MNNPQLDLQTLSKGPVSKYFSKDLLDEHLQFYGQHGYTVYQFDAKTWHGIDNFHSDLHAGFEFPAYFGRNLDALNDCLTDLSAEEGNVLVVVRNFDLWYQDERTYAKVFLDYMAHQTYRFLLQGARWITLIQSNSASFDMEEIGSHHVHWNQREWPNRDRGL